MAQSSNKNDDGEKIQNWMEKKGVWDQLLYEELKNIGINTSNKLHDLSQESCDNIIKKVYKESPNSGDALEKFEELYRKIKKSSGKQLSIKFSKFCIIIIFLRSVV